MSILGDSYHAATDSLPFLDVCLQDVGGKSRYGLPVRIDRDHLIAFGVGKQPRLLLYGVCVVALGAGVPYPVSVLCGSG